MSLFFVARNAVKDKWQENFESYLFVLKDEKGSLDGNWKSFYHNGSSSKYWIAAADWLYIKDEGEIFYILMTLLKDQRCYTDLSPILNV